MKELSKSSAELSKAGRGFAQGQQWSLGVGHIQGVGSERDNVGG